MNGFPIFDTQKSTVNLSNLKKEISLKICWKDDLYKMSFSFGFLSKFKFLVLLLHCILVENCTQFSYSVLSSEFSQIISVQYVLKNGLHSMSFCDKMFNFFCLVCLSNSILNQQILSLNQFVTVILELYMYIDLLNQFLVL